MNGVNRLDAFSILFDIGAEENEPAICGRLNCFPIAIWGGGGDRVISSVIPSWGLEELGPRSTISVS